MADTERIVKEAVRAAQRRAVRMALTGYLIFLGGVAVERYISSQENLDARETIVKSGTVVAVRGCNARFQDRKQLRELLMVARRQTLAQTDISAKRKKRAATFYTERLDALRLPDCRKSLTILSADPDEEVHIPAPLFPAEKSPK